MSNLETFNRVVLVGVDMENDFMPGGSLAVDQGNEIVEPFNDLANWVRQETNGIVTFTRDWHPAETNHFGNPPDYRNTWPVHCVANTFGAEFHKDLDVREGDPILSKGTKVDEDAYSGFQGVAHNGLTLESLLSPINHERVAVLIGGLATDYCVQATVLDSLKFAKAYEDKTRYVGVYAVSNLMRAVAPETGVEALTVMREAGVKLVTSEQLISGSVIRVEA